MRQALIRHRKARYRDVAALRRAWGVADLSLDTVTLPTLIERQTGEVGMFHDPATSWKVVQTVSFAGPCSPRRFPCRV